MIASGCVWSTCGAVDEGVEQRLDRRPRLGGRERAAEEVVDHVGVVHSLARDERQDLVEAKRRRSPTVVIVARSVPEPFTQRTRVSRPRWSSATPFADVFPPPWLASARSAPSRFER